MKVFSMSVTDRDHTKNVLSNEIQALSQFSSPFISKLLEVYQYPNYWFYIMLRYDGDLQKLMQEARNKGFMFPVSMIKEIMRQVCMAVQHIHDKGFVHSDIKLENILYKKLPDKKVLTGLTDFTSVWRHKDRNIQRLRGTLGKVSPECLNFELCGSIENDIWSLAVVFIELTSSKRIDFSTNFYSEKEHYSLFSKKYFLSDDSIKILSKVFVPQEKRKVSAMQFYFGLSSIDIRNLEKPTPKGTKRKRSLDINSVPKMGNAKKRIRSA